MALPGGKRNPEDTTPHDVARREAFEEVGVTLSDADLVGMMPRMTAGAGGVREMARLISPAKAFLAGTGDRAPATA